MPRTVLILVKGVGFFSRSFYPPLNRRWVYVGTSYRR
jgi:hypothetical protein